MVMPLAVVQLADVVAVDKAPVAPTVRYSASWPDSGLEHRLVGIVPGLPEHMAAALLLASDDKGTKRWAVVHSPLLVAQYKSFRHLAHQAVRVTG